MPACIRYYVWPLEYISMVWPRISMVWPFQYLWCDPSNIYGVAPRTSMVWALTLTIIIMGSCNFCSCNFARIVNGFIVKRQSLISYPDPNVRNDDHRLRRHLCTWCLVMSITFYEPWYWRKFTVRAQCNPSPTPPPAPKQYDKISCYFYPIKTWVWSIYLYPTIGSIAIIW